MTLDFLQKKLDLRIQNQNLRTLSWSEGLADFVSNDYLGLARNIQLGEQIKDNWNENMGLNGGTGSRLLSGNYRMYQELEDELAQIFNAEKGLVFNSGYAANQALVSSVAERGDTILYDQLSHVCLKEGAWLSKAQTVAFLHNDLDDLKRKIKNAKGKVFVVTETIFSMDGDFAPLQELVIICEQFGAYLIVDEAHSTGCYGPNGAGILVDQGLHDRVFARVYTFGKAMGVHGACVAGSKVLVDFLVNFGRPFIYTTSLPPHSVLSIRESFRFLNENQHLQADLRERIEVFVQGIQKSRSNTAIQPIMIGSNETAKKISNLLQSQGYDVRPILSPTVKKGTERLRISLHVHNSLEEIKDLTKRINSLV